MERGRMAKRPRLRNEVAAIIGRYGVGMNELADASDISRPTLYALRNKALQPMRTTDTMRYETAWKIAKGFASVASPNVSEEEAFTLLMEEVEVPPRRSKKTEE